MQIVEIETIVLVLNLIINGFLQTSVPPLISIFYAKERGGYHDLPLKIFCLTVPKKFVGELFCVSENFGCRKVLWIKGGGVTISIYLIKVLISSSFSGEVFLSHRAENFRGEPFLVLEKLWYRKISCVRRGCITISRRINKV